MADLPAILEKGRKWLLLRLALNSIVQALTVIGSMLLVRYAFDIMLNPAYDDPEVHLYDMSEVGLIALFASGLLGCTGLAAWLRLIAQVDAERLGQDYVHCVRKRLFDRMGRFAPRALSQRSTGASSLRFIGDLSSLRRWVSMGIVRIMVASIISLLSLGFMAYLDLYLALCSAVVLSIGLGWNLLLGPRMHQAVTEARKMRGRLAGNINEKIRSFIVIQAFNQQRSERKRFSRQSRHLRDAMVDRARASSRMRVVTDGATAASMGMVLALGAVEVFKGMTTAGNVVAAMAVVGFLSNGFRDLGRVHEYLQSYRVSKKKIGEFLNTTTLKGRSRSLPDLEPSAGSIEFRNVSLSGALEQVSATVTGGSRVALFGPNGSGKSTLLQITSRLVDPSSGEVLFDGQNIRRCNLSSVRQAIGIISPDLPLLRGSVGYNLRYRRPDTAVEEMDKIIAFCHLDNLLEILPKGENYRLEEGGQNLSLGQRHRLMIARALLGNPKLLIIDEIDASLDPSAVEVLDRLLDEYPGTILIVTRDTNRMQKADQIWHFSSGRLGRIENRAEQEASKKVKHLTSTQAV